MSSSKNVIKQLSIDFETHTDGDADFKAELIMLMIDNIKELQEVLRKGVKQNNFQSFRECSHKITPTLTIINDSDFLDVIESIKHQPDPDKREHAIELFNKMCEGLIQALKKEAK